MGTTASANVVKVIFDDGATAAPTSVLAFPFESTFEVDEDATDAIETTVVIADEALNGPTLTYQWFAATGLTTAGGTKIDGATDATFSPDTDVEGSFYYYVVVSNSKGSATSNVVKVEVEVAEDGPCGIAGCDLHLDDICFMVIREVELVGTDYKLIVSREALFNSQYKSTSDFMAWENEAMADGSLTTARSNTNAWYSAHIAINPIGRLAARAVVPSNVRSELTFNIVNQEFGYSAPTSAKPASANDVAFVLSNSEVSGFMTTAQRQTTAKAPATTATWIMRSPGDGGTRVHCVAGFNGSYNTGLVTGTNAIRPALWIE
jgi:hypothetical protein